MIKSWFVYTPKKKTMAAGMDSKKKWQPAH
jgi:hypothetical protein